MAFFLVTAVKTSNRTSSMFEDILIGDCHHEDSPLSSRVLPLINKNVFPSEGSIRFLLQVGGRWYTLEDGAVTPPHPASIFAFEQQERVTAICTRV
jgi:hypothetical protein